VIFIHDTDIFGKHYERKLTNEEHEKLWVPFVDAQTEMDGPEQELYRETVEELNDQFPLEAISPGRVVDYVKYSMLCDEQRNRLIADGYDFNAPDRDQENPRLKFYLQCCRVSLSLRALITEEGDLYVEEARAKAGEAAVEDEGE
jgi:hypothetical protein